ncbi:MAG: lysophospholipid acyltransferase family protein [Clostridiaceae bacterium]
MLALKSIYNYTIIIFYMIGANFKRLKLERLRKQGQIEQANEYLNKNVLKWSNFLIKLLKINIEMQGMENIPDETFLLVSNHQSDFDIPIVMSSLNKTLGFVAKKEMESIPFISYWMKQIECIFMDRSDIRKAVKSINEGVDKLKNGKSMSIFPEGTRSRGDKMGEFKKGSLKLAMKSNVPILPLSIDGSYKIMESNHGWMLKSSVNVKVKIMEPIYMDNLNKEDKNNIAEIVKEIIYKNK